MEEKGGGHKGEKKRHMQIEKQGEVIHTHKKKIQDVS